MNPALELGKKSTKLQRSGSRSIHNYDVEGLFEYVKCVYQTILVGKMYAEAGFCGGGCFVEK